MHQKNNRYRRLPRPQLQPKQDPSTNPSLRVNAEGQETTLFGAASGSSHAAAS